jgi:hypothetical protein
MFLAGQICFWSPVVGYGDISVRISFHKNVLALLIYEMKTVSGV